MQKLFSMVLGIAIVCGGCNAGSNIDDGGSDAETDGRHDATNGDDGGAGDDGMTSNDDGADVVLVNNAEFVSQNVPASLALGESFDAEISMRNTGTTTWTADVVGAYRLGAENPRDNTTWGTARMAMAAGTQVAPGATHTFQQELTAPETAGTYDFQWQMVQEGVEWFGQASANLSIEVTGTCIPLTCEQADVICGTVPDGCGGEIVCGPCCGQCVEVFNDSLNNSTQGTRTGGQWVAGGGWQTHGLNNRIIYAFSAIHCGYLEVDVRNFDPTNQYIHKTEPVDCDDEHTDCYVHFLSLYRGDHGNHHAAANNCESQIAIQVTGPETAPQNRTKKFKSKASTTGWDGGGNNYSNEYTWNTEKTYHLKLEWNSEEMLFYVDGQQKARVDLSWPGDLDFTPKESPECTGNNGRRLALTHFFLGRDFGCQGCLDGPIYSNLLVYDCNP